VSGERIRVQERGGQKVRRRGRNRPMVSFTRSDLCLRNFSNGEVPTIHNK